MRKSLVVAVPLLSAALAGASSCSKPPPPSAPTPTIDAGAPFADAAVVPAPSDAGPVVTGPVFFTGDAGSPAAQADAGSAVAGGSDQVLDAAVDVAISTAAPKVAPKMQKEGQPGRATLKEGEHFGMVVTLQPNRCYTFVGFSPPGNVSQLDLRLFSLPLNIEAGKSGPSDKSMPVMGKGNAAICPVLPVAVPYKLDVVATKGHGRIGVYVYSRSK